MVAIKAINTAAIYIYTDWLLLYWFKHAIIFGIPAITPIYYY